jgi:3D (Asp-Asp-Asp) domain-containing protein
VTTLTNLPAITANWLTAAGTAADFGTEVGTAVWATGTRTLTAGTNIDGSTFTAIPWNASWDAEVQSEVEDALVTHRLDELLNADSDIDGAAPPTVGSVFHELMSKTAGSFTFDQTTDSCEALRDRGDAAWTTATGFSTHSAADVWAVATRVLTAGTNIQLPSNGLANVTAWTVAITGNVTGNLSGSVGSVTGAINTAAGVITTLDGLDTAQDTQHATTQTAVADVPTNAELATALDALPTAAENAAAALTTQMTEAYAADGTAPTLAQAVFLIMQMLTEKSISSTTLTVKKLDGSTSAATFTLDSATTPTSITRSG